VIDETELNFRLHGVVPRHRGSCNYHNAVPVVRNMTEAEQEWHAPLGLRVLDA